MPEGALPPEDDIPAWGLKVIRREREKLDEDLPRGKGWAGIPFVDIDGQNWPLEFAAAQLGIPEEDLRYVVRRMGVRPAGVLRMAAYRRSGRQPRAYEARKLIIIAEKWRDLAEALKTG